MKGSDHYLAAEIALDAGDPAVAQVHATLALVAVIHDRETGTRESLRDAKWREVLG